MGLELVRQSEVIAGRASPIHVKALTLLAQQMGTGLSEAQRTAIREAAEQRNLWQEAVQLARQEAQPCTKAA